MVGGVVIRSMESAGNIEARVKKEQDVSSVCEGTLFPGNSHDNDVSKTQENSKSYSCTSTNNLLESFPEAKEKLDELFLEWISQDTTIEFIKSLLQNPGDENCRKNVNQQQKLAPDTPLYMSAEPLILDVSTTSCSTSKASLPSLKAQNEVYRDNLQSVKKAALDCGSSYIDEASEGEETANIPRFFNGKSVRNKVYTLSMQRKKSRNQQMSYLKSHATKIR